jgi:Rod binding domain-containing protein
MTISPISPATGFSAATGLTAKKAPGAVTAQHDPKKVRETFDTFVGETFYGQMLKALRSTVDKPAYFHGGRAEEVFQAQFDQVVAQQLAKANAGSFTGPMFEQFMRQLDARA